MDQRLKQRLVGAIVLISLAIIFIPIILEGPDDEWSPRTQDMPLPPQIDYKASVELPLPDESPEPVEPDPVIRPVVEPELPRVEEKPAEKAAAPAPPPAAPEPPKTPAAVASGGWVVQVGSFGSQSNARGLRDRLQQSGYKVFIQDVTAGGKETFRVLVGPEKDRSMAEKLRDTLAREQKLKGIVIKNPL